MAVQRRQFVAHRRLLEDVIKRQAGTLSKAIMEGAMNAIDARASRFRIILTADRLILDDDGKGIPTEEELVRVFETFGQPHTEEEAKIYGTFRMGRGQIFSFGKNIWRTATFKMTVDVRKEALAYDLETGQPPVKGCRIGVGLYEPLDPPSLDETIRQLRDWLKYSQIPVTLNGETITVDRTKEEWDHETDDAFVRLNRNGALRVYNLGVHTMDIPGYRYGAGGTLVTKVSIGVNFARNDVMSTCPVWKRVKGLLEIKAKERVEKKSDLTDDERSAVVRRLLAKDTWRSDPLSKLLPLYTGDFVSGRAIGLRLRGNIFPLLTVLPDRAKTEQVRQADRIDQMRVAVVFSPRIWEFAPSANELKELFSRCGVRGEYRPFAQVAATVSDSSRELIPDEQLTAHERLWLKVLERLHPTWAAMKDSRGISAAAKADKRRDVWQDPAFVQMRDALHRGIRVGRSGGTAEAWTDGRSYIAFDRDTLAKAAFTVEGLLRVLMVYQHELAHVEEDAGDVAHSIEFYRRFHDMSLAITGSAFSALWLCFDRLIKSAAKRARVEKDRKKLGASAEAFARAGRDLMGEYQSRRVKEEEPEPSSPGSPSPVCPAVVPKRPGRSPAKRAEKPVPAVAAKARDVPEGETEPYTLVEIPLD